MTDPLFGFTGDNIISRGQITLSIETGSAPLVAQHFMEFLVVDHRSAYHGVLGRPALKDFWAVTSIHYLCIKFSTEHGIATIQGDQMGSRACYLNSLRKSESRTVNVIITEVANESGLDVEMLDTPEIGHTSKQDEDVDMEDALEEGHPLDELDPQITGLEPNTTRQPRGPQSGLANRKDVVPRSERTNDKLPENEHGCLRLDARRHGRNRPKDQLTSPKHQRLLCPTSIEKTSPQPEEWISNSVLVRKPSGKWRVCIDFTNLNKACPKDSFPLPRIDHLVDFTAEHELLSFTDACSGYNHKPMFRPDEEATSFIKDRGLVTSGQFLGYIVNQRGIEENSVKIRALQEMRSPQKLKEVQSLNGRIDGLSHFISKATDKSLPFFKVLK
ncbi:uncharacterized protein LOC111400225 [Olea europaea var. sylvestris]|uniref:uncharacterized protein LOC111400225 n=1 Tax=Olea europaea var. sylvestris TaxID=158386 RepID=UPI000C1D11E2|nr:uncharacterized protein LOC111400225 [Olea europaea var. sylvestris]